MKKLPIDFFEKSRPQAKTELDEWEPMMYEIKYLLTTGVSMEEWLDDFIVWLESRDETVMGTIEPYIEEKGEIK